MTLHIDNQSGSKPLIKLLRKVAGENKKLIKPGRYESGDAHWEGVGGKKYAVEVKHMEDLLKCINDGRFVSQLRRMQRQGYDEYWLLLVDEFKAKDDGTLVYKKTFGKRAKISRWIEPWDVPGGVNTYRGLINWLTTMELLGGCHLWHVQNDKQAAWWLWAKYRWAQKKKHKGLDVFDTSRPAPRRDKKGVKFIGKPNEIACVANALVRGLGWEKSKALSYHFNSVEEFLLASSKELQQVKGIGKKLAEEIVLARSKKMRTGKDGKVQ